MEIIKPTKKQYKAAIILNVIALILVLALAIYMVITLIQLVNAHNAVGPDDQDTSGVGLAFLVLFVMTYGAVFLYSIATILNIIACVVLRHKKGCRWDAYSIITVILVFAPAATWGILYGACMIVSKIINAA